MGTPLIGADFIVEMAVVHAETILGELTEDQKLNLESVILDYLGNRTSYEDAAVIVESIVGRPDPIERVKDVMDVSDTPMPNPCDSDEDTQSSPSSGSPGHNSHRKKTRTWTSAEDLRLLAGVARYGTDNWQGVAHFLGNGRNRAQCSQRWLRCLNPKISKKTWTQEEDNKLKELVMIHGTKSWMKVANILGNRSDVQCRYHYKQLFGNNENDEMPMMLEKGNMLTNSSEYLRIQPPIQNRFFQNYQSRDDDLGNISLGASRAFASSPLLPVENSVSPPCRLPLAPVVERRVMERPLETASKKINNSRYGVCGSDQVSLDLFLGQFN